MNYNRPLVIELISKRITKCLIDNSIYFRGTNLYISEFLDENARKIRRNMREKMIRARRQELRAAIKNQQL